MWESPSEKVAPQRCAPHLGDMSSSLPEASLKQLFHEARTLGAFTDQPVTDDVLRALYDLVKLTPTSANSHPTRYVFVKSPAAKDRLAPSLSPGNLEKTMKAPVTVIVAVDTAFHEQMPTLFPARGAAMKDSFAGMTAERKVVFLEQNAGIEAGALILAARSLGLDAGPMGGFDRTKVDAAFFPDGRWRSTLLINLGYGERSALAPRLPRLDFATAARIE